MLGNINRYIKSLKSVFLSLLTFLTLILIQIHMAVKIFSGRKRESSVWKYFEYDEKIGKSRCNVVDIKTRLVCQAELVDKNPTNLKSHLASNHSAVNKELLEEEATLKAAKCRKTQG